MYVEVLVVTSAYGSAWITGTQFVEETQPSKYEEMMPNPPPTALPRGGPAYGVATYKIRHCKNTAAAQPSTKETATLTIRDTDDHYIKDRLGQHYFSLAQWHLKNPFATEEEIAKEHEKNGSPWSHTEVLIAGEWITGCMFLAERNPARPGDDGPVPRSYGATIYDNEMDDLPYDTEKFINALIDRESLNLSVTDIMKQYGPGIPDGYTFDPEEFVKEFEQSFLNPQNYWDELSFLEMMDIFGPRECRPTLDKLEEMDYETSILPKL
jgi:hypothetical protein